MRLAPVAQLIAACACAPDPSVRVFAAHPLLEAPVHEAVAAWHEAGVCRDVAVVSSGWDATVSVWLEDTGEQVGWRDPGRIAVSIDIDDWKRPLVVAHELGHEMGGDHVAGPGLMTERIDFARGLRIEGADLDEVCR